MRVAIQGIKGSNHHRVAVNKFGNDVEVVECNSFTQLVDCVCRDQVDIGIMAIENSIAGSIITNYNLIIDRDLFIVGEYYINIEHFLMALPGQKLDDIIEIKSHPMALNQCLNFLSGFPNKKLVEDEDTAAPAAEIAMSGSKTVAAIAPKACAKLYGLEVLASNIESQDNNMTRFLFLNKTKQEVFNGSNKASLRFVIKHEKGSLHKVLSLFADNNLNLTKILSLPIGNDPWKYAFLTDVIYYDHMNFLNAWRGLHEIAEEVKILGAYKKEML